MFSRSRQSVGLYITKNHHVSVVRSSDAAHGRSGAAVITPPLSEWNPADAVELIKVAKLQNSLANSVLSPGDYQMIPMEKPSVVGDELLDALAWRVKDVANIDPIDAVYDYVEIPDTPRLKNMMYLVVADKRVVERHIDQCASLGIKASAITVPELAMLSLIRGVPDLVGSNGLLWVGEQKTILIVVDDGLLIFTRSFDVGYKRLVESTDGMVREALLLDLQRSMDYYESQVMQKPIKQCFVLPCEEIAGTDLVEYLDSQLNSWVKSFDISVLDQYTSGLQYEDVTRGIMALAGVMSEAEV